MTPTVAPHRHTTRPPSTTECAYSELLGQVVRSGNLELAWACALVCEDLDPSCSAELAERLYNAVKHG